MRVEIISLDDHAALCCVTGANGGSINFSCGSTTEAHNLLRLMVHNAARELAKAETDRQMAAFGRRAHAPL